MYEEDTISTTTKENTACQKLWIVEVGRNSQLTIKYNSFSINLFLNLHTVNLPAGIENNTKDNIGWRLFIFYTCYIVINLAGSWIV